MHFDSETLSHVLELAFDLALLLPPMSEFESWSISPEIAKAVCFGGVGILTLVLLHSAAKEMFGSGPGVMVAVCVFGIGWVGLPPGSWDSIFLAAYVPMILSMRFAEGIAIGQAVGWRWGAVVFLAVPLAIAASLLLSEATTVVSTAFQIGWVVLGGLVASVVWARQVAPAFGSLEIPPALIAVPLLLVFLSTSLYVDGHVSTILGSPMVLGVICGSILNSRAGKTSPD